MNKKIANSLISTLLASTIMLSGCGKKSECELPTRHVHKYVKEVTDDISIEKYMDNEQLVVGGYNWTDNYIEITKEDELLYDAIEKKFVGVDNWDYLYYTMANQQDYLKFYYEYTTTEIYTTTDDKGHTTTHTRTVHHDGWTTNPNRGDNTGRTRLYHHQFYGYCIVYKNGKYKLEKSPLVDDIREIINDYPYFSEDCVTEVYEEFRFKKSELKYLSPDDFDIYNHPDLSNKDLYNTKTRIK